MSGWWPGVRLVIGRELLVGVRRRSFRLTVAVMLLVGLAGAMVPRLFSSDDVPSYDVAVVGESPAGFGDVLESVAADLDIEIDLATLGDEAAATTAVTDGDVDVAVVWPSGAGLERGRPRLVQESDASDTLLAAVSNAAMVASTTERLEAVGIEPDEADEVLAPPPARELVDDDDPSDRSGIGFLVVLALYLFILSAGNVVASGVAVEKSNRIAESLLATMRASQLLAGKVIGIGVLSLVTMTAVAGPVVVSFLVGGDFDVPAGAAGLLIAGVGWFVLGYALYACAYAVLGALVDRQEEVSGAVTPLTTGLIVTYFLAIQANESPASTLAVVASMFPLTAPMVMPMRTAAGAVSGAAVAVSVLGIVVTTSVLVIVGAKVYRRAMVRTGRRLKLREVIRA